MINKAQIDEFGKVTNIAVFTEDTLDENWIVYTDDNPAYIGGEYKNGVFIAPKPECGHSELQLDDEHNWECSNNDHKTLVE
jgi:hypothetical protein